jgi:hypothetical protein
VVTSIIARSAAPEATAPIGPSPCNFADLYSPPSRLRRFGAALG